MFGDFRRWLEIFGDVWMCLEMSGDVWRCFEMFGDVWGFFETLGDLLIVCLKMFGDVRRCLVLWCHTRGATPDLCSPFGPWGGGAQMASCLMFMYMLPYPFQQP